MARSRESSDVFLAEWHSYKNVIWNKILTLPTGIINSVVLHTVDMCLHSLPFILVLWTVPESLTVHCASVAKASQLPREAQIYLIFFTESVVQTIFLANFQIDLSNKMIVIKYDDFKFRIGQFSKQPATDK